MFGFVLPFKKIAFGTTSGGLIVIETVIMTLWAVCALNGKCGRFRRCSARPHFIVTTTTTAKVKAPLSNVLSSIERVLLENANAVRKENKVPLRRDMMQSVKASRNSRNALLYAL